MSLRGASSVIYEGSRIEGDLPGVGLLTASIATTETPWVAAGAPKSALSSWGNHHQDGLRPPPDHDHDQACERRLTKRQGPPGPSQISGNQAYTPSATLFTFQIAAFVWPESPRWGSFAVSFRVLCHNEGVTHMSNR